MKASDDPDDRRTGRQGGPFASLFVWLTRLPFVGVFRSRPTLQVPPAAPPAAPGVPAALAADLHRLQQTGVDGESGELRMVRAVLSMDTARVREIMRPRVDMVAIRSDATPQEAIDLINESGHSKVPLYRETIDDIVGVVYARDLLKLHNGTEPVPKSVRELARPAIYVPESQRLEQLLREFQRHRTEIAIVVDEYGGVSGLVTVQDLIEEIVGELVDEFDRKEPGVERVGENEAVMDARLPIDSFNGLFGSRVQPEGFDTVGGLVYRELGKMPVVGDTIDVENLSISVESTVGRRIRKLRVKRKPEVSDTPV
ncbi:MAG: HlyC/CorC family transporter [Chloroflexi bacterium]|nr:HlyC/CorC family transporter [Chloroflexota bacterium]